MGLNVGQFESGSSGDPFVPARDGKGKMIFVPSSQANDFYEMEQKAASALADGGAVAEQGGLRRVFGRLVARLRK